MTLVRRDVERSIPDIFCKPKKVSHELEGLTDFVVCIKLDSIGKVDIMLDEIHLDVFK